MITAAEALLEDIEVAIADEPCQPTISRVTAGEPAEPAPGCFDVAVWVAQVTDDNAFDSQCMVRSRLQLNYRIGWCYRDRPETGPTVEDETTASACLYGLMEAVWCYLVEQKSQGLLSTATGCTQIVLEPFVVQPRGGGWVSAIGSVILDYDCLTSS